MPGALQLAVFAASTGLYDSERAAAFARERWAKAKGDAVMTFLLAQLEADVGRRKEALALLDPLCDGETPPPAALSLRGMLLLDAGDYAGARAALKKGTDAYPDAADLHYLLAQSWLADPSNAKDGEPQEPAREIAVKELRIVLANFRTHAPAMNNLAFLLSRDEKTRAEALQFAETAVQEHAQHAPYLDTLATVLTRLGRRDQALAVLQKALGACDAERAVIERMTGKPLSTIEKAQLESLKKRNDRTTAEVKARYDEALRASTSR
jgi:tetratricopeptide (TPR) repeat protein